LQVTDQLTTESHPVAGLPGQSRFFVDFCSGVLDAFLPFDRGFHQRPPLPAHRPELVHLIAAQNRSPTAQDSLAALAMGAGTVLTGQQVGLFGGPLFSPFKAATAIARARRATAAGDLHTAIFWLATEDHDFAEISQIAFPLKGELAQLAYGHSPASAIPAAAVVFDDSVVPLVDRAAEILGPSAATDALIAAYKPGRNFAQAFADFYSRIFAAQGLLMVDASSRDFHRLGAPVLRAAIERADELHSALAERTQALESAGYHAQVDIAQSTLLFLIDSNIGARVALRRIAPTPFEPNGLWHADRHKYSTGDLIGILTSEPERISPAALLRPVFQDFLFSTSALTGGPAEVAYFGQSAVLYQRILGRQTPVLPRFSATLIEPAIAKLLARHQLTLDQVWAQESAASLAQNLAELSMPIETKQRLDSTAAALDSELDSLVAWLQAQDQGLGQSADTAAGKMRYQMNRLRTLALNFQLQREATLSRHAESIFHALYPGRVLQERVHGAAYYFARYGLEFAETICSLAADPNSGHTALWL